MLPFVSGIRQGEAYEDVRYAIKHLSRASLWVKDEAEKTFEAKIIGLLQGTTRLRKKLISQIDDEEEKIISADLFSFKHYPDASIDDTIAIEIKVVSQHEGPRIRELLGQALVYRFKYKFVVLVLVDRTDDHKIVKACKKKNSDENNLLKSLSEDYNIFTLVGPVYGKNKNMVF